MRIAEQLVEKEKSCEVIFTGDFNYRINMSQQQYSKLIKEHSSNTEKNMKYQSFLDKDQLGQQHSLKKFFEAFEEGQITFPPTYKLRISQIIQNLMQSSIATTEFPGGLTAYFTKLVAH